MSNQDDATVIECKNLGKCYQIYDDPKARLKQALWGRRKQYYREFWALRDVNFQVKRGESLGIIGRNGSGKSTLLQLICGTLTPTEGTVETKGRIAALLELGSGFNPEFTGVENVYLNASMLGLSKAETDERIDDIIGFADIGSFIYQPVKTYSSGMSVRLAFAVIAHVDADILVVDEALAVGDAVFTQRCMRFIRRMREQKCLLFVSHDSEAVKSLCSQALWLVNGEVQGLGDCKTVSLNYLHFCQSTAYGEDMQLHKLQGSQPAQPAGAPATLDTEQQENMPNSLPDEARMSISYEVEGICRDNLSTANGWRTGDADLVEVKLCNPKTRQPQSVFRGGEHIEATIRARANKEIRRPILGFIVKDRLGQDLFGENTIFMKSQEKVRPVLPGCEVVGRFRFFMPMLPSGEYTIMASIADGELTDNVQHHWVEDAVIIKVHTSRVRYGLVGAFIDMIDMEIHDVQVKS